MNSVTPLTAAQVYHLCDPETLDFETTEQVPALTGMIGQERATRAVDFGLRMQGTGYNIYMAGVPGTGKTTYAVNMASKLSGRRPAPRDWVYVYNFDQPDQPQAISLPPGQGRRFQSLMADMVSDMAEEIVKAFESEEYEQQRQAVMNSLQTRGEEIFRELDAQLRPHSFTLRHSPTGYLTIPLDEDGQPMSREEFEALSAEKRAEFAEKNIVVKQLMNEGMRRVRSLERETREALRQLDKELTTYAVEPLVRRVADAFADHERINKFLKQVLDDIIRRRDSFRGEQEGARQAPVPGRRPTDPKAALRRYEVNLLVDNTNTRGAPVVVESNPTYHNLIGKVEYVGQMTGLSTDHTQVKAGSLHRANGGYLILQAKDVLINPGSWDVLKRSLTTGRLAIEPLGAQAQIIPTRSMRPEPIPLNVKVILIGNPLLYHLLHQHEEDFPKLFKVRADFDTEMDRNEQNILGYAGFISSLSRREGLRHFDRSGVARVIEYSSRLAGDKSKLSTRFNEVVEILYEANAWAEAGGTEVISRVHVAQAISERIYRSNRMEEKVQESINRGQILVDVTGKVVGQVNGLAVLGMGNYHFGKPSRITARIYMGERGVVNIERETEMSGKIHDKGLLTLTGYLGGHYAQDKPLSLSASLTFEQLYSGIDGDSASSAELYALLSALSGLPIDQGIAVTGSINQYGEIQPIGGVNEKIEGFHAICKNLGLTGKQGVAIPVQNVDNLMLSEEVVEDIEAGRFHVWALSSVDQGLELLTGVPAGEADEEGRYPPESVHGLVDLRLTNLAQGLQAFRRQRGGSGSGAPASP